MPHAPEGKIFSPSPEDRQEEQRYVQGGREQLQEELADETQERIQQGQELIERMEQTVTGLMHEIDSGNLQGDARDQAFGVLGKTMWELEVARKHLALVKAGTFEAQKETVPLDRYVLATATIREKATEMEQDIKRLGRALDTERLKSNPDAALVRRLEDAYGDARERMLGLRDEFEDLSGEIPADDPIRQQTEQDEQAAKQIFSRILQVDADRQQATTEQLAAYDMEVGGIIDEVKMLEQAFEFSMKKKGLTQAKLQMLHDGLTGAERRLFDLDVKTSAATVSELRTQLLGMIDTLREKYPADMRQAEPSEVMTADAAGLTRARGLHQKVHAVYAQVWPRLSADERRSYRTRIAQLTALVRHAEDTQWKHLFKAAGRPAEAIADHNYFKSRAYVHTAALLALNRASHLAPTVAQGVSVASPARRSVFSVIGGAFKLK